MLFSCIALLTCLLFILLFKFQLQMCGTFLFTAAKHITSDYIILCVYV